MKTVVLGGGLVGQYAAYKLKARLLTLKPEGAVPYLFLHNAPENRAMLDDLDLPYKTGRWTLGFMFRGAVYNEPTSEMVTEYHQKTYGHLSQFNKPQFQKSYFDTLDVNYYELHQRLSELVKDVTYGRIISVDVIKRTVLLSDETKVKFDRILNTLPLPDIMRMVGMIHDFEARPLFIYKQPTWDWEGFDTVQVMDADDLRTRYVRGTAQTGTYFLETIEQDSKYGELATVIKYGKIRNTPLQLELRDNCLFKLEQNHVFCVGRFARFTNRYDTQDALRNLNDYISKGAFDSKANVHSTDEPNPEAHSA